MSSEFPVDLLPFAFLSAVFDLLDYQSLKCASAVNKSWFYVAMPKIANLSIAKAMRFPPGERAMRNYKHIRLERLSLYALFKFLSFYDPDGEHVRVLELGKMDMQVSHLVKVLSKLRAVRTVLLKEITFDLDALGDKNALPAISHIRHLQTFDINYLYPWLYGLQTLTVVDFGEILDEQIHPVVVRNTATLRGICVQFPVGLRFEFFQEMQELGTLEAWGWVLPTAQIEASLRRYRTLRVLRLRDANSVRDSTIRLMINHLTNLVELSLVNCHEVSPESLCQLFRIKGLKKLTLCCRQIDQNCFRDMFARPMPNLEEFSIEFEECLTINPDFMTNFLTNAPNIRTLKFKVCRIQMRSFVEMAQFLKSLKELELDDVRITTSLSSWTNRPEQIPPFHALKSLKLYNWMDKYYYDAVLAKYLVAPELEKLEVRLKKFLPRSAEDFVQKFPTIRKLRIFCMSLRHASVDIVASGLPHLADIKIQGTDYLTIKSLTSLITHCDHLKDADLNLVRWSRNNKYSAEYEIKSVRRMGKRDLCVVQDSLMWIVMANEFCKVTVTVCDDIFERYHDFS